MQSRREFLRHVATAGTVGYLGLRAGPVAAEPPPETTRIKLAKIRGICIAPQYVAEELLGAEGFTDVQYVQAETGVGQAKALASGEVEMSMNFAAPLIVMADSGAPLLILAGVHVGCFELFGNERVRSIRDLKGKTVGVHGLGSTSHIFLTSIDRKSTRLNSSHSQISYAVFCLKKKSTRAWAMQKNPISATSTCWL